MAYEKLNALAKMKRWDDLEGDWLSVLGRPDATPEVLLPIIDTVVEGGGEKLAATMGWAWLSVMKEKHSAAEALRIGRGLLLRLPDGEELREEILNLYKETHSDHPDLDGWIERSGLRSGKSVRRALRYLDRGLKMKTGVYLIDCSEDIAAEIVEADFPEGEVTLRQARRTRTLPLSEVIEDYDIADENDFHVLQQLHPDRIEKLAAEDPTKLVIGILRCHRDRIDRDELKLMLVPRYVSQGKWADWWGKVRNGVKKSPNLRIEGRSPMFLLYDPVGRTPEEETWAALAEAKTPRQLLDILEAYLRDTKLQKSQPDLGFLDRVQSALVEHIERFRRHAEPHAAFATALVIERLATDGLPIATDAHGTALEMLRSASDPVKIVGAVPDLRLWSLAMTCVEQAFPDKWPELFAELILYAPAGKCDFLAGRLEAADRAESLQDPVDRAIAEPGRFTDAMMWIWKGPDLKKLPSTPPPLELFHSILALVGPARLSEGRAVGQTLNEMRAKVRAGLGAKNYASFRDAVRSLDLPMARTVRRLIERAEALGPSAQGEMLNILSRIFPKLYVKEEVPIWEDEAVLYFTRSGLAVKEAELDELVNVKMRENAKAIGEAAAHGDLSENSEYKFAIEERDLLRARVAQINREVSIAKVLDPDGVPVDHVSIGQEITLRPANGGEPLVMKILGVGDSDVNGRTYAYQTPLARQVLGKRPGDTVSLALDGGNAVQYEVDTIERAPL